MASVKLVMVVFLVVSASIPAWAQGIPQESDAPSKGGAEGVLRVELHGEGTGTLIVIGPAGGTTPQEGNATSDVKISLNALIDFLGAFPQVLSAGGYLATSPASADASFSGLIGSSP